MFAINFQALHAAYPDSLRAILSKAAAEQSRDWLASWPQIRQGATPMRTLPTLAARLGLAWVAVKDESERSPLGSFKPLGAPIALVRLVLRRRPGRGYTARGLFNGQHRDSLGDFTVISATDGNHGRALAAAAQSLGCRCVIVIHGQVSDERERAIAAFGAQVIRIAGNYDESVAEAARLANEHGWEVVSDTSYEGYEEVPRDVMQGYSTIAAEAAEQAGSTPQLSAFTHVFVPGGVGGLAAGVASYLWELHGAARPQIIVAEPDQADCLYRSALAGRPTAASGSVDSVMAGLACGEPSPLAWRILQLGADGFVTVSDDAARFAMQVAVARDGADTPVLMGESGAASLAGLLAVCASPDWKAQAGLGQDSRVLLISTEGATAPAIYQACVGESAVSVLARQAEWMARTAS